MINSMIGKRFGRLLVLGDAGRTKNKQLIWRCKCDCGVIKCISNCNLGRSTSSCGCLKLENTIKRSTTHGFSGGQCKRSRLYNIWKHIRARCLNKNNKDYAYYGGRKITVCGDWNDYKNFHKWAMANGYKKHLTIDRINNHGNYEPSNCRWATRKTQARNKRGNRYLTHNGKTMMIAEWAEHLNVDSSVIRTRLYRKWSIEKTLTTPINKTTK